jgi:acyl carrier protein
LNKTPQLIVAKYPLEKRLFKGFDLADKRLDQFTSAVVDDHSASAIERDIIGVWEALLGVSNISTQDNFFELGGDSLLATRLISLLRKKFTLTSAALSLKDIFEKPYVPALVNTINHCIETSLFNNNKHRVNELAQEELEEGTL